MIILLLGLLLFTGIHSLRELGLRDSAVTRLSPGRYRIAYSLIASAALLLIVWGKADADFITLYVPRYELRHITHFAMLPAFILVAAGNLPMSYLRRNVRHPMLLGTVIWGVSHLWANGDVASIVLFGGIGLWALMKFVSLAYRVPLSEKPPRLYWDLASLFLGFVVYALVLVYHGQLFGIGLSFV